MTAKAKKAYRALVGINYPNPKGDGEIRVESGELAASMPVASIPLLIEQGMIEEVNE